MGDASTQTAVVDVRSLVPAQRHAKIFELVNALEPGASFILVNDHDPKPLYYQLDAEYPGQFSWTYVESGPTVWRVEIGKLAKAA
ncbi:MAG: hemerythrin [Sphingobium sp. 66-54]|nr:MAG: hemerythrin [Sphingobium sp. 66-54]